MEEIIKNMFPALNDKPDEVKPKNPNAFPLVGEHSNLADHQCFYEEGMTLRDYFAGKIIAGSMTAKTDTNFITSEKLASDYAEEAYLIADAMLKIRLK